MSAAPHFAAPAYWNHETEDGLWSRERLGRSFPLVSPYWRKIKDKRHANGKLAPAMWVLESQAGVTSKFVATVTEEDGHYVAGIRGFFWRTPSDAFVNRWPFPSLEQAQERVSAIMSRRPDIALSPFAGYPEASLLPGDDIRRRLLIHAAKVEEEGWHTTASVLRQAYEEITRLSTIHVDIETGDGVVTVARG